MEIKGISGIIPAYKGTKVNSTRKSAAAAASKNTDRVEFGFAASLDAAKAAIAQDVRAGASPRELLDAGETARRGVESGVLAEMIFMG